MIYLSFSSSRQDSLIVCRYHSHILEHPSPCNRIFKKLTNKFFCLVSFFLVCFLYLCYVHWFYSYFWNRYLSWKPNLFNICSIHLLPRIIQKITILWHLSFKFWILFSLNFIIKLLQLQFNISPHLLFNALFHLLNLLLIWTRFT
jgi:hypothetical protein